MTGFAGVRNLYIPIAASTSATMISLAMTGSLLRLARQPLTPVSSPRLELEEDGARNDGEVADSVRAETAAPENSELPTADELAGEGERFERR